MAFKFLGPYEVIKVKRNQRYDVEKVGGGEGPFRTSTCADSMKLWATGDDSDEEENEDVIDEEQLGK